MELRTAPGEFIGWQLGSNVSLLLGQRQSRAAVRREDRTRGVKILGRQPVKRSGV